MRTTAPFTLPRAFTWVTYPLGDRFVPDFAGFAIRILITPTLAELRAEAALYEASYSFDMEAHDRYWQGVAYRVIEWNLSRRADDGTIEPVLAPAEGGWERFLELPWHLGCWVRAVIHHGHTAHGRDCMEGRPPRTPELRDENDPIGVLTVRQAWPEIDALTGATTPTRQGRVLEEGTKRYGITRASRGGVDRPRQPVGHVQKGGPGG